MKQNTPKAERSHRKDPRQRARMNPQFQGIGKEFVQTHNRRRSIQLEQKQAANRVAYLLKEHQTTQKRQEQKQADLDRLLTVIGRKQADEERRHQLREQREAAIAMQREQNVRRRHEHQQRLRNAYLSIYDQRKDASDDMRRTFNNHNNLRQSRKLQDFHNKKEQVLSISSEKKDAKMKVDSYFKARNDSFTETYKQKINQQRKAAQQAKAQINTLSEIEGTIKMKLESSTSKLNEVANRYEQTYRFHANRSALSVPNSRSFLLRDSISKETKEQSNHQVRSKAERMIEKQLSFTAAITDV